MFFLASPADEVAPAHRQATVTVLVGETYEQVWRVMCQSNWQAYADRHGFDLIVIAHRPDMSPRGQARIGCGRPGTNGLGRRPATAFVVARKHGSGVKAPSLAQLPQMSPRSGAMSIFARVVPRACGSTGRDPGV